MFVRGPAKQGNENNEKEDRFNRPAIRTLLRIIGMKNNARVNLKINEPEGSTRVSAGSEGHMSSQGHESSQNSFKTVDQAMEDLKGI